MNNRTRYQGAAQIFRFNLPFYVGTISGVSAALVLSVWLPAGPRALILVASGCAIFWICSSLLVSHYVYDRSALYSFSWLSGVLQRPPVKWINIHSGIDESSGAFASMFPGSQGRTADIYDPQEMTEPSIERARRITSAPLSAAGWRALPAPDHEFDTAFLIFAAHELRHREAREQLFREVARVLQVEGEAVLVEHLRDWANFMAFGPGFMHFFSGRTWRHSAEAAGFRVRRHSTVTPFVHVFMLRRPA